MLRIRLATGEEAVYRTVDELALGISSGTITAAALVFDAGSKNWRSIHDHPEYHEALTRAAALSMTAQLEPEPVTAVIVPPALPAESGTGPFQIYQMVSQSALELQARKRPAWLLPAATAVAGIVMVASLALALRGDRSGPIHVEGRPSPAGSARPALGYQTRSSAVIGMPLAPANLAVHRALAIDALGRGLADSADGLGLRTLLSPGRLYSRDSVLLTREQLASLRPLIADYRSAQRRADSAYRDSAASLVQSGIWSRVDEQEWRFRTSPIEPGKDAARADSLLVTLERLFDLLAQQADRYQSLGSRVRFDELSAGEEYDRLRARLARHRGTGASIWPRSVGSLAILLRAVGSASLAPRAEPVSR